MLRVGADIGGTFTDIVLSAPDGAIRASEAARRRPTTTAAAIARRRPGRARAHRRRAGADRARSSTARRSRPTRSSSSKGARTGLITTEGFRDVLEIRRLRMPRALRHHLGEAGAARARASCASRSTNGSAADGEVRRPLDLDERASARSRRLAGARASSRSRSASSTPTRTPSTSERSARCSRGELPGLSVSLSCRVLPESSEYERTSTTVVNAYVEPVVRAIWPTCDASLDARRHPAPAARSCSRAAA